MNFRSSAINNSFRIELLDSWVELQENNNILMRVLRAHGFTVESALILSWTPEQGEDFYLILVNGKEVVYVGVSREDGSEVEYDSQSVLEYEKALRSRMLRVRLAVARNIALEIKNSNSGEAE